MAEEEKETEKEKTNENNENTNGNNGNNKSNIKILDLPKDENVAETKIEDEIKSAYIDYAMSVIVSRAIPSAEDGLKPVQRRILYAMHQLGMLHNKPTRKSSKVIGDTMAKYHPHGDMAIYDTLVRMTQSFSLRYPLVEGQGNFGSIDADPPAAHRYTEVRLNAISEEMLQDIGKKTVKMLPNFDNSLTEPEILPAKFPNLLVNGAIGIAVGMMTSIPPHNLNEVIDAVMARIKKPEITVEELMNYIQGPDFPTAAAVYKDGLLELYKTGRGSFVVKGKIAVEKLKNDRERIIITEIPYQVNKTELIERIVALVHEKKLDDIQDIRDESSRGQIRIVIVLRRGANSKLIINKLYSLTSLQSKFNAILLALVAGQPKILNLRQLIESYLEHRRSVVKNRTKFDLHVAEEHAHILSGLIVALKNLDDVISLIKKSKNVSEASASLINRFKLTGKQAQAVLDMRLQRLTQLEQDKLKKDYEDTIKKIEELKKILGSEDEILNIIKQELQELKKKYGDDRKTRIIERISHISEIDLIKKEEVAVALTAKGYIKRMPLKLYKEQHRGGIGISGAELTTGDFIENVFVCSTHDFILFLTERGKLYLLKAYHIPEAARYTKGKALVNILNINEKIKAIIPLADLKGDLFIVTKKGISKKIGLESFIRIGRTGVMAMHLPSDDAVIDSKLIDDNSDIFIATKRGIAVRFDSKEVRKMGKGAYGVTAIRLDKNDEVIALEILNKDKKDKNITILTLTEKGFGKRSSIDDYRKTARAAHGIININCSSRNGNVIAIQNVNDKDSVIVSTAKGMVMRVPIKYIRVMGRNTQGVRIIKLKQDDSVTDVVKVPAVE